MIYLVVAAAVAMVILIFAEAVCGPARSSGDNTVVGVAAILIGLCWPLFAFFFVVAVLGFALSRSARVLARPFRRSDEVRPW